MRVSLARRLASELLGTAFLLAAVVGSGIMAERLSAGNNAVALLANTIATGAALVALILTFAPISGAHFNPLVTIWAIVDGVVAWREGLLYLVVQVVGAIAGTALANAMFSLPPLFASTKIRTGYGQWIGEFVATFGLIAVIITCSRRYRSVPIVAAAVAAYISAAYWFTSSTSFANPAVTIGRSFSDTFAGICPQDVPGFIISQIAGGLAAMLVFRWLVPLDTESV